MKEAYLQSVRALLDCPAAERERMLERLEGAVSAWLDDTPDAGQAELIESFGTPEACAARLLEECDPAAVAGERLKRKRHSRILIAVLAMLLAAALGAVGYLWAHGGLVIIELKDAAQDAPKNQIIYHYDD